MIAPAGCHDQPVAHRAAQREFLGKVGGFGAVIGGLQLVILERDELRSFPWCAAPLVPCMRAPRSGAESGAKVTVALAAGAQTRWPMWPASSPACSPCIRSRR